MKVQCDKAAEKMYALAVDTEEGTTSLRGKEPGGVSRGVGRAGIRSVSGH